MNIEELKQRYAELAHAMQSGVAIQMNRDAAETSPKHLRVGVNSAMVDAGVVGTLLIRKGLITEEEYFATLVELMEREVESYRLKIDPTGRVTLR